MTLNVSPSRPPQPRPPRPFPMRSRRHRRHVAFRCFSLLSIGVVLLAGQALFGAASKPVPMPVAELATPALAREAMLLLKGECFSCHNEKKKKGGLVLTSRELLLKGNDSGPAAEPGRHESSLMTTVLSPDADPHMPPERQLTDPQIQLIRNWIQSGMPWDAGALI